MELLNYKSDDDKQEYFYHSTVNNVTCFKELINSFNNDEKPILYRGVNNKNYRMYSSIQREFLTSNNTSNVSLEDVIRQILFDFKKNKVLMNALSHQLPDQTHITDYSILAFIQHYGGPTPLLDFTSNLSTALFFAFDGREDDNYASLYIVPKSKFIFGEIGAIYNSGYEAIQKQIEEIRKKHPQYIIDTSIVESKILEMIFNPKFEGVLVFGGTESFRTFGGNNFAIANYNIWAQDGYFIQGACSCKPLDESLIERIHCHYGKWNYIDKQIRNWCIDISPGIIDELRTLYKVPNNREHIYPSFPELSEIQNEIFSLKKKFFQHN